MGCSSGNKSVFWCSIHYSFRSFQVENENHCDFTKLREMLIRTNMEDLCDSTHSRHYELYRKERLKQMGFEEGDKEGKVRSLGNVVSLMFMIQASSFAETYTMRRESHLQSLQEREEEMRQKFVLR